MVGRDDWSLDGWRSFVAGSLACDAPSDDGKKAAATAAVPTLAPSESAFGLKVYVERGGEERLVLPEQDERVLTLEDVQMLVCYDHWSRVSTASACPTADPKDGAGEQ